MDAEDLNDEPRRNSGRYWWLGRVAIALLAFLVIAGTVFWFSRERIAGNLIDDALAQSDLEATYDIVSIGPQEQVIENFVIGDPARPDLTIERIVAEVEYGLGAPQIGRITAINPRFYGTLRDGTLSFGALDAAIYGEGEGGLPALNVAIVDARGLVESDLGNIGLKLNGEGMLDDGFTAKLAATAPGFGTESCKTETATLYGDLAIVSGLPQFEGPLRLRDLDCEGVAMASADITADLTTTDDFSKLEGEFALRGSDLGFAGITGERLSGTARLVVDDEAANFVHDFSIGTLSTPYGGLDSVITDGSLRSVFASGDLEWNAEVTGQDFIPGDTASVMVADAKAGLEGTLLQPLLTKLTRNLDAQARGASLAANVTMRSNESGLAVIIPEGRVMSPAGEPLLAVSRVSWAPTSAARTGALSGDFITGGAGLPQINGRMEQRGRGALTLRANMNPYSEGVNRLAIPRLELSQSASGNVDFTGIVRASGNIPGGSVSDLTLPIAGIWGRDGTLVVGRNCTTARFASLEIYDLALQAQRLDLCPEPGAPALLTYGKSLNVGIATNNLVLTGELGGSPITLSSAGGAIRFPEPFELNDVSVRIGNPGSGIDLTAASITGDLSGDGAILASGAFEGGSALLDPVPLDLTELAGAWRYEDSELIIDDGVLTLSERTEGEARFYPLGAQGARFTLAGSDITANADLRHPGTGQLVSAVTITHDLGSGVGQALLDVPGVTFGQGLEPGDLTYLTQGVIAFAEGTVTGEGVINWTEDDITSSGTFGTRDFDLAAAFGPVEGLSGDIVFSDLLAMTTEPDQEITLASVNPGIEVLAGKIVYSLTDGELVSVADGRWPFMGGELVLRPTQAFYGEGGEQRYTFDIVGMDAAKFIAQLELTNLSATGTFDGTLPVIFDDNGNGRIEGGQLTSRSPGGNLAYVGELTYEDMGTMANYAFQTLRSLDYNQMQIGLNGDLAGEIITNMTFDGVRQGEGTSQNFITKQIAKLPIRFNVNVRSQNFYQLATMVRSFWDPSLLGDPVNRGTLPGSDGQLELQIPVTEPENDIPPGAPAPVEDAIRRPDEPAVQVRESEGSL
ncbi:MAG: YdbH domain-containing protein [Pseudomonadota bacterium]